MKRYKLLKDLPTFKAGDVFELRDDGCLYWCAHNQANIAVNHCRHWREEVMAYYKKTLETFPNILKDWFEEIKEPEEHWYWYVTVLGAVAHSIYDGGKIDDAREAISNYFKTEEEAKKAVEKLKAWKRLKDAGFKFDDWYPSGVIGFKIPGKTELWIIKHQKDLDLLFGGEE